MKKLILAASLILTPLASFADPSVYTIRCPSLALGSVHVNFYQVPANFGTVYPYFEIVSETDRYHNLGIARYMTVGSRTEMKVNLAANQTQLDVLMDTSLLKKGGHGILRIRGHVGPDGDSKGVNLDISGACDAANDIDLSNVERVEQ